jgi:formate hydrogenlyase subunit 3/multisubunit Na+/H+ antiporter MnhD subunit
VLAGTVPAWWGWTLLLLGLASAVLGVLWALAQGDLKRLLAYSSVENVGIILMGMGLGVLGTAYHQPGVALLGYAGALLHTLNHALFKGLLFLAAGAVVRATGTREIDRLGGLARRMPQTAVLFLIGSVAIVGLPPLNGFVSEWLLVRGFLHGGKDVGLLRFVALGAAGLSLVAGLAVACFVRVAGSVFVGTPRDRTIEAASNPPAGMALAMAVLALACVAIGLAPKEVLRLAQSALATVLGSRTLAVEAGLFEVAGALRLLGGTLLLLIAAAWVAHRLPGRRTAGVRAPTWTCAFGATTPHMQYTAASFGAPLLRAFPATIVRDAARPRLTPHTPTQDFVVQRLVRPAWDRIQSLAGTLRPLQQGRVTTYLQYMIWTVLLLLGFLLFASAGDLR